MLANVGRRYCTVIVYNHEQREVMFVFFNRQGRYTTPRCSIEIPAEFRSFARGLWGMKICSKYLAGLDLHRDNIDGIIYYHVPFFTKHHASQLVSESEISNWILTSTISHWYSICGRATLVISLTLEERPDFINHVSVQKSSQLVEEKEEKETSENTVTMAPICTSRQTANRMEEKRKGKQKRKIGVEKNGCRSFKKFKLECDSVDHDNLREYDDPHLSWKWVPSKGQDSELFQKDVILKESWPLKRQAEREVCFFGQVQNCHGIPDIVGAVIYENILDEFNRLSDLEPDVECKSGSNC